MRNSRFSLLALSVAASLTGTLLAQGDDCTGALNVINGTFGPFTNAGATTSAPAWPCGLGGIDVWFSYVAPGNGSLTVDLCGASYDCTLEVFDGTGGCGGLVSMFCNDDSCGLQSSVTVTVTLGTTYFFRVGGFNSQTGTFPLNVAGPAGSGTTATANPYGTGCVARAGSFYEHMTPASTFDLNNTSMTMLHLTPGYLAMPLGTYVAPTGAAITLALLDDSEVTQALTTPFPYDGGVAASLTICSNGFVSVATGNGTAFTPSVPAMLSAPQTAWWCHHDYNPIIPGSGVIKFEEVGPIAYITWDGVWDYGSNSAANASTWQMQFDSTSGNVVFAWQTMSPLGGTTLTGFLVGHSPGGASLDPGSTDISVALPATFPVSGLDIAALALAASSRPIVNTTISLNTTNIPAGTPFGAIILGLNNPGIDLGAFGMAGCTQYTDSLASLLFVGPGATNATSFLVPNAVGVLIKAQSAVYCPAAGLTVLGAIASQGVDLFLGNQ